jgi:hypothetical protein
MEFDLKKSLEILERTPSVLEYLLRGISEEWSLNDEGDETFSPYDVVGHLIHGERTDWMVRMEIILSDSENKTFEPFDRFAQFEESDGIPLNDLLTQFKVARDRNLRIVPGSTFSIFMSRYCLSEMLPMTRRQVSEPLSP